MASDCLPQHAPLTKNYNWLVYRTPLSIHFLFVGGSCLNSPFLCHFISFPSISLGMSHWQSLCNLQKYYIHRKVILTNRETAVLLKRTVGSGFTRWLSRTTIVAKIRALHLHTYLLLCQSFFVLCQNLQLLKTKASCMTAVKNCQKKSSCDVKGRRRHLPLIWNLDPECVTRYFENCSSSNLFLRNSRLSSCNGISANHLLSLHHTGLESRQVETFSRRLYLYHFIVSVHLDHLRLPVEDLTFWDLVVLLCDAAVFSPLGWSHFNSRLLSWKI